jgi:hypothetical protein
MLYIHAGTGKTGTTYLQSYFAANAQRLGLRYPNIGRQLNGAQMLLDGHHALALDHHGANSKAEWERLICLIQSYGNNDDSKWLVSTENLTYAKPHFLSWLSTRLDSAGINHTFLLFVRDTRSYAESIFLERVKVGAIPLYSDVCDFLRRHTQGVLVDELIATFIDASGERLILLDYNQSRLRGTLLDDFLHALGVVRPGLSEAPATPLGAVVNESLVLEIANCLTYLSASILDGLRTGLSPETILDRYLGSLEAEVVDSTSFIVESERIPCMINEAYQQAQKQGLTDFLLRSRATLLTHEFNSAWRDSRISLKPSQAVLMDFTRSEQLPQLKISQEKTQFYLEKMCIQSAS